jgi:hypothetical protein
MREESKRKGRVIRLMQREKVRKEINGMIPKMKPSEEFPFPQIRNGNVASGC